LKSVPIPAKNTAAKAKSNAGVVAKGDKVTSQIGAKPEVSLQKNKITAFAKLLGAKEAASQKHKAVEKTVQLKKTNQTAQQGDLKNLLAALQKPQEKGTSVPVQKIEQLLKTLIKNNQLPDELKKGTVAEILEKLKNKEKINKNELIALLAHIDKLQTLALQPVKKGSADEKKSTSKVQETEKRENNAPRVVIVDLRKPDKNAKTKNEIEAARLKAQPVERTETKEGETITQRDVKVISGQQKEAGTDSKQFLNSFTRTYEGLSSTDLQKLNESLKNEIVKNTGIVLKTNDTGEIHLILKPDALGKVKINLNLKDNRLDGQILVENSIVKEIIETSLDSLNMALKKEGFDSISLQVSLNGENKEQQQQETAKSLYRKEHSGEFEKNIPLLATYNTDYNVINLMI